jgi:hypothetical protein
VSNGGF